MGHHHPDHPDPSHAAVEAWVRQHQLAAWRYARLRGCPADVADDLVQESLMAGLCKGIAAEPPHRARAWLLAAIENLWLMHLRTEGRRDRGLRAALAERATRLGDTEADETSWTLALRTCLTALEGRARRLLDLHYADGASRAAIAAEFGMRENGVKAFLQRVRRTLRDCVLRRLRPELEA